jgi:peptide/nickel transport system ATP-binding protein
LTNQEYLEIENLVIGYPTSRGEIRAVDGVSFHLRKGRILGLIGESGSGKSTLGLSILSMVPAPGRTLGGRIRVGSTVVSSLSGDALRRYRWKEVAMVFQSAMNALDPVQTVGSQIVETIRQHSDETKQAAARKAVALLEAVRLDRSHMSAYPHELSGGMRQRVMIALSLCLSPSLLIADEPTTGLDVVVQSGILSMLKEIVGNLGLTLILISHDISIMGAVCDEIAVMYAGKLVEIGEAAQVINDPRHPYTRALLGSIIEVGDDGSRAGGIRGTAPDMLRLPTGCRFHPRCPRAFEMCAESEPRLTLHGSTEAACWLKDG